jgi:hypothetical protein
VHCLKFIVASDLRVIGKDITKTAGMVPVAALDRKADAGYKKDGTECRLCSQLNSLTQRREGRVSEKLGHETQASERKTTRKQSLLSSN